MSDQPRLFPASRAAVRAAELGQRVYDPDADIETARAQARAVAAAEPRFPLAEVRDLDAGGVPTRLYRLDGAQPGVVLHLHGGGFVFHDIEVHDNAARRLADRCGTAVLSVDYRRPPEHRFPAAPDDVDAVLGWLAEQAAAEGLTGPVFAHGDSAGGNLALVAALRNPGRIDGLALTYPFLDPTAAGASYQLTGVGFEAPEAAWYWEQYAAEAADLSNPDLAPLLSEQLAGLPPTLVVTAEGDPLRDEGEALAARLAELGVRVVSTRYQGQQHGFWRHPEVFDAADPLSWQIGGFFRWVRSLSVAR